MSIKYKFYNICKNISINLKFWFKTYPHYSKEEKSNYHLYKKSNKKAKREIRKALREMGPWDWGWLVNIVIAIIRNWRDYYKIGYNVNAMEAKDSWKECKDHPTRLEIAEHLIDLYEQYQEAELTVGAKPNEQELLQEFFEYLGKWIMYMWD